jgi:hypothetical protein
MTAMATAVRSIRTRPPRRWASATLSITATTLTSPIARASQAGSESRAGTASTQLSSGPRLNMGSPTMSDDVVHWPSSGEWLLSTS